MADTSNLISLLWQRVIAVDDCRKVLIENEAAYIAEKKRNGLSEIEAKQSFYAQLAEYIKDMENTGKEMQKYT